MCAIYGSMLNGGVLYDRFAITYPLQTHERNDKVKNLVITWLPVLR